MLWFKMVWNTSFSNESGRKRLEKRWIIMLVILQSAKIRQFPKKNMLHNDNFLITICSFVQTKAMDQNADQCIVCCRTTYIANSGTKDAAVATDDNIGKNHRLVRVPKAPARKESTMESHVQPGSLPLVTTIEREATSRMTESLYCHSVPRILEGMLDATVLYWSSVSQSQILIKSLTGLVIWKT